MNASLDSEIGDTTALTAAVLKELRDLRGEYGRLTVQKFSGYPTLRRVCGGGDLLDAFLMFEREMKRYVDTAGRDEVAAALSITAPADAVLDRLEHVVGTFEEHGTIKDQRTGRRWSDNGLKTIAADLVYMAEVQGRLGTELLTIEVSGNLREGLRLVIYQLTTKQLDEKAPLVRFWRHTNGADELEEQPSRLTLDLEKVSAAEASNGDYRMKRHHVHIELPSDLLDTETNATAAEAGDTLYSISIEGRDAPMRTVSFTDESELGEALMLRMTSYRTTGSVEVVRR